MLFGMQAFYDRVNTPDRVLPEEPRSSNGWLWGWQREPFKFDYTALESLVSDPAALVDRIDLILTHGQLSDNTRDTIIEGLRSIQETTNKGIRYQISFAVYLVMISPDYIVVR